MAPDLRLVPLRLLLPPRLPRRSPPLQCPLPTHSHPRQPKPPRLLHRQHKALLLPPLQHPVLPAPNASIPLRWSVASPKNTASTSVPSRAPVRAAASPNRTSNLSSREAPRNRKPMALPRPPRRHPLRLQPVPRRQLRLPLRLLALLPPTAPSTFRRCSSVFRANAFTLAITKCSRSVSCARKSPSTWSPPSTFRRTFTPSTKSI